MNHDRTERVDTVVLDVDGTLVDSVYVHVQAWCRAFHEIGTDVPSWRIHRAIGMGGDRLVASVAGQRVEDALGDDVRALHDQHYEETFGCVRPLPGADELLEHLRTEGFTVVMASSGSREHTERALELLEAADVAAAWVSSADADSSKPAPDLVEAALERAALTPRRHDRRLGVGRGVRPPRRSPVHRPALRWLQRGGAARGGRHRDLRHPGGPGATIRGVSAGEAAAERLGRSRPQTRCPLVVDEVESGSSSAVNGLARFSRACPSALTPRKASTTPPAIIRTAPMK